VFLQSLPICLVYNEDLTLSPRLIRRKLLGWFRKEKRQLPWRGTGDPYRIWVSEVMLQQTTVAAVRGRYERFLWRFPNLQTLARAREESVLAAWSGLGYYARARNLWRAARQIAREHGGRLPRDPAQLRKLPGFGDYMVPAVASLAFGARLPAADANVTRVISRLFAIGGVSGSPRHRHAVRARVAELLPRRRPGDFTAALMDLGQTVCTARRPACRQCPVTAECLAFRRGQPGRYPRCRAKPKSKRVYVAAAYTQSGGRVLLARRAGTWLRGLWEFPSAEGISRSDALRHLSGKIGKQLGLAIDPSCVIARARHSIVNRRLSIEAFRARPAPSAKRPAPNSQCRWFRPEELTRAAIPTLTRKIALAAGFLTP